MKTAKVCRKCKTEKPMDMFYLAAGGSDGYKATCKTCICGKKPGKKMRVVRRSAKRNKGNVENMIAEALRKEARKGHLDASIGYGNDWRIDF